MDAITFRPTTSLINLLLQSVGQTSDSIHLGFQRGFDSGEMMDRIYQNHPSGRYGVGVIFDWVYLNQIGCKGLRGRKALLKKTLHRTIDSQRRAGKRPAIVDVASGPATYLVEVLAADRGSDVQALGRDLDKNGLKRGEQLAKELNVNNIRYQHANALDESSFRSLQPTIVISSGFYEILTDDDLIRRSMRIIRNILPPGGTFIFTTQVNHPQLELIKALPNRNGEAWIMKNRSVAQVESWAHEAGFTKVKTTFEPHKLFSVTVAQ
jgi:SAM-dependent methyltransferase